MALDQQNKEELMLYTNDLYRLASKAQAWGLRQEEVARLQSDIDAIKHLASTSYPVDASSPSRSSFSSSPPSSPRAGSTSSLSSSPPATATASGFLSSTLTALSANASTLLGGQQHSMMTTDAAETDMMVRSGVADLHKAVGSGEAGPKRRNRGKNLPKDIKRACAICKAEKTSQWRSGADGRPTLCNACGLRYRHSMKQHRQYLARQQLNSSSSSAVNLSCAALAEQPQDVAQGTTTTTAYSHQVLLQHLMRLRHQQQQHLSKTDSTDSIGSEDDSPACSSSPADPMPRRSSIYSLLN